MFGGVVVDGFDHRCFVGIEYGSDRDAFPVLCGHRASPLLKVGQLLFDFLAKLLVPYFLIERCRTVDALANFE